MRKRFMLFIFTAASLPAYTSTSTTCDFINTAALAFKQAEAMLKEWELNR